MKEITSTSEIRKLLTSKKYHLVGIDGIDGAGKSTLAKELSTALDITHINLDDYVEKEKGNFVDFIDFEMLNESINKSETTVIVEGICLLEVLSRIGRSLDLLIYIKRISSYGAWRDEGECEIPGDIEEFIQKKKQELKAFCKATAKIEGSDYNEKDFSFPTLREEIFRYHYTHQPHKKADVYFIRKDC